MNQAIADFALLTFENQEALMDLIGPSAWEADLTAATLTLDRPYRIAFLGTWSEEADTFWWGWANTSQGLGADHPANAPVAALRARSGELGMPELAHDRPLPVADLNDLGWLPASGLASVAAGLLGANAVYSGPYPGGRAWFALLDAPPVRPNPVKFSRLSSLAFEAAASSPQDVGVRHRNTVALYAARRGLGPQDRPDGGLDLVFPGGSRVECEFDEPGRLVNLRATLVADDVPPPLPFEERQEG